VGAVFSIVGMIGVVGMMQGYVSEIMLTLAVQWGYDRCGGYDAGLCVGDNADVGGTVGAVFSIVGMIGVVGVT